jgi:hypothetical protein
LSVIARRLGNFTAHTLPQGTGIRLAGCFGNPDGIVMNSGPRTAGFLVRILKSYGDDVRKWLAGIGTRYAAGIGLMVGGALLQMVAAGVGTAAALHYVEIEYGTYTAYAIVGGAYGILGVDGLFAGRVLLGRSASPAPSPQPQIQILKQSLAVPTAALFLSSKRRKILRPDALTQVLAVGAAATLLGWVAATQLECRHDRDQK